MGNFGSVTITGLLLDSLGQSRWEWLFYFYGGFGFIWSLLFFFMTYDNHTLIPEGVMKDKEKEKLDEYFASIKKKEVRLCWVKTITINKKIKTKKTIINK